MAFSNSQRVAADTPESSGHQFHYEFIAGQGTGRVPKSLNAVLVPYKQCSVQEGAEQPAVSVLGRELQIRRTVSEWAEMLLSIISSIRRGSQERMRTICCRIFSSQQLSSLWVHRKALRFTWESSVPCRYRGGFAPPHQVLWVRTAWWCYPQCSSLLLLLWAVWFLVWLIRVVEVPHTACWGHRGLGSTVLLLWLGMLHRSSAWSGSGGADLHCQDHS